MLRKAEGKRGWGKIVLIDSIKEATVLCLQDINRDLNYRNI